MNGRVPTNKSVFEEKIKPKLTYIGTIGATLMLFAYIAIVVIMVFGFQARNFLQTVIFAIVNAVIGFVILQFLKKQGVDLARTIPENIEVLDEYNTTQTRDKKFHSMKWYWFTSIVGDVLMKVTTILLTTIGLIYIIIEGSQDYMLFLMAFVNIIMFICLGLLSLAAAYDFFNDKHIPYIQHILEEQKNEKIRAEEENKKLLEMAAREHNQQRDDNICVNCRVDLLDSCVGSCNISDMYQSLVVDSSNGSNSVLGGSVHTRDSITNSVHSISQDNTQKK